ncbi:MAG: ankyrin repeat domain-containing protein [Lewinellaceae bacterium]|nr:ankyrin repeat domain-containing protein [Lewinellaceae bacterium]
MMKAMIIQILISCLLLSCTKINRDKQVNKEDLTGDDYRLFQNTPAWDLAKAVQDEDEKMINEIVSKDPKLINYQDPKFGNTLLILTIMNQQIKPFKVLVADKADINIHNNYEGTSAVIEACSFKQYDIKFAEILLQNGANANDIQTDKSEPNKVKSALMKASKTGKLDLVELLLKNGADINYQNEYGQSALSECVMVERYNVAIYLLQKGADNERPIFYRPDYSIPVEKQDPNDKGKPMYLVDVLREDFFDFNTDEYKYKMQIVDFLKSKGIDYRSTPIPDYIKKKAQEEYLNNWKEYLEKY